MRVFLGLTEIAGFYRGLAEGLRELGVECCFLDLSAHPFAYGGADEHALAELSRRVARSPFRRVRALRELPRAMLLSWATRNFDAFVFGFGGSFLEGERDLPLLRALNKVVIAQFHGSDARPPYLDGSVMARDRGRSISDGLALTRARKARMRRVEASASALINIPPQAHLMERRYVNWLRLGLPCRPRRVPAREAIAARVRDDGRVRVLHSPSHPAAKGSGPIAAMVARLSAEGLPLELVELRGRSNDEVLDELSRADLVVDQLYADYALPGFASEAAWYGVPVLIGGYARALWERLLPEELRPPTDYLEPEAIEGRLRALARDAALRRERGLALRDWVERHATPKAVAARYLQVLRGDIPEAWWLDPRDNDYWQGCGQPEARTRELLRAFVAAGGPAGLCVGDKPALEARLLEVAGPPQP